MNFSSRSSLTRFLRSASLAAVVVFVGASVASAVETAYLMSYFTETNGTSGLKLAYSLDGLTYHSLNGASGVLTGTINSGFMRDPSVYYCQDGVYRMVYTTAWGTTSFGYSESTDLIHWTTTSAVNIMSSVTGASVTWAPEIIYDSANSQYVVYWSSSISSGNKSIYYSTTTDFKTYSSPQVLYNPGYTTIDADIVWNGTNYVMLLKDERSGYKYVYLASGGTSVLGTYTTTGTTAVTTIAGLDAEGPATIKIGDTWYCYVDLYGNGVMALMTSTDNMATWQSATTSTSIPTSARHATVISVAASAIEAYIQQDSKAEITYIGTGSSNFNLASNWFGSVVPGSGQTVAIEGGNSVILNTTPSGSFAGIKIGQTSSGTLTISGSAAVYISSTWPNGLILGDGGTGDGTIVQSGSSSLTIGGGGGFVSIGKHGTGTYRLQSGSLTNTGDFNIGDCIGGHGYFYVEGGNANLKTLFIGGGYSDSYQSGNSVGLVSQTGGTVAVTGSSDIMIGGRYARSSYGYGVGTYSISDGLFNTGSCNLFVGAYGSGVFNQTGGTVTAGQWLSIGRYGSSAGYCTVSGGTMTLSGTSYRIIVGESGTGTLTISGSGLVDAAGVRVSNSSTAKGTVYLNGGTLLTNVVMDNGGTSYFYFDGGTLKAKSSTTSFMYGLDGAYVLSGGAKINTNGYNVTVAQSLLTGVSSGADGGLTKTGSGTLTLTGDLSYTGVTTIEQGQITVAGTCTLSSVVGSSGTLALGTDAVVTVGTLVADSLVLGVTVAAATASPEAVPEPATITLILAALATAGFALRRRRKEI